MLVLTASLAQAVLYAELIFTIGGVGLPFSTAAHNIRISVLTSDNYYRINQTYSYVALAGSLNVGINCLNVQVGVTTNCIFDLSLVHSLLSSGTILISLPSVFPVESGSASCGLGGTGLNVYGSCIYNGLVNTITVGGLVAGVGNIAPMGMTVNVSMVMSYAVGNYSLKVSTMSGGGSVDVGGVYVATVARKLTGSQLVISSSAVSTYSPTSYTVNIFAPFDRGYVYTVLLSIPTSLQLGLSPTVVNGVLVSYLNGSLNVSVSDLRNVSLVIGNFMTGVSLQPYSIAVEIYHVGEVLFYGTQSIAMTVLRSINTLSVVQSNEVVYSRFTANFVVSDLEVGDVIRLSAPFGYFYAANQTNCSTAVVVCQAGGTLKVLAVGNGGGGLTSFSVVLVNQAFIGSYVLNVSVYDGLNVYGKQSGVLTLGVTVSNLMGVVASRSNAYLNESAIYTFNMSFTTPNATYLMVRLSPNFTVLSVQCNVNCGVPMLVSGGYLFSLSSTWVVITFSVVNPIQYGSFGRFTFQTSGNDGDKDFGVY